MGYSGEESFHDLPEHEQDRLRDEESPTLCEVCGEPIDVELHDVVWEAGYRITTKAWHRVCRESLS